LTERFPRVEVKQGEESEAGDVAHDRPDERSLVVAGGSHVKLIRIAAIFFGVYVVLGLALDGAIGYFQPQRGTTAVLRSFDEQGKPHDTVLSLLDDGSTLWVESGHWFRGWYHRIRRNPDVELVRGGETRPYRAVPLDTPEALEQVQKLMGKGRGAGYWAGRAMLLFAPIKPVRLDPRPAPQP
jgi:hypothetical protein